MGRLIPFILAVEQTGQTGSSAEELSPDERKILKANAKRLLEKLAEEGASD